MTSTKPPTLSLPRRAMLAMALSAGLLGATGAQAGANLVDLSVVDRETGQALQVWRQKGRMFVAGQTGNRYGLRVTNNSPGRVLVVMSVDGVNIVSGETASYDQGGYVLAPYQTHEFSGWRKSDSEIAAFAFASQSRSYAARTGRPHDVGVIGLAVFRERVAPPPPVAVAPAPEYRARPQAAPKSRAEAEEVVVNGVGGARDASRAASIAPREDRLGTAHGAREWSRVVRVSFDRASSQPDQVRQIEYDTRANLVAAGVIPPPYDTRGRRPRPFPAYNGYAPDPPPGS